MFNYEVTVTKRLKVDVCTDKRHEMTDEEMIAEAKRRLEHARVVKTVNVKISDAGSLTEDEMNDIRDQIIRKSGIKMY